MATRKIILGGHGAARRVEIGGGAPVSIQTMWKEPIALVERDKEKFASLLREADALSGLGCDIIRFAVPDKESAASLRAIARECQTPIVADIHFDHNLALSCLEGDVAAIRINPGNIGRREDVEAVVARCGEKGVPIRVGVNAGSLPKDLAQKVDSNSMGRAVAVVEAAAREIALFDELDFKNFAVSVKASSVKETIDANVALSQKIDAPLHIGVTEAGPLIGGVVKSALALSALLARGIGDTLRVSLSSSPSNEVVAAREILRECGARSGGVKIVSCPRCGRQGFDVHSFVSRWQNELLAIKKDLTVAVMGCVVNGPGEGRRADIGIAGANGKAIIFKKGKIVRTVDEKYADKVFREELESL